jgi:hypothetical protein
MGDADDAVAGLEFCHCAAGGNHFARGLPPKLLGQREGRAAGNLVAGEIAGPVLHIPARHRTGMVLTSTSRGPSGGRSYSPQTSVSGPPYSNSRTARVLVGIAAISARRIDLLRCSSNRRDLDSRPHLE